MVNNDRQLPWLAANRPVKVAIIGDIILDEYLDGEVNRISPEAPVPVHQVKRTYETAGGAANVARNIQLAGGEATLCAVCGQDLAGEQLKSILESDGIDIDHIVIDKMRPTVKKTQNPLLLGKCATAAASPRTASWAT